ncbi:Uncharacterised protein [Bordetella pertussis]|nr:Uncharacterised protein [Bordetella pertussis]
MEYLLDRPKKSITGPAPNWPLFTLSGTPKERSVTALALPDMRSRVPQPSFQPSPCRIVSTVRCMVPERDGAVMLTWPNQCGASRSFHSTGAGSLLALM